MLHESPPTQNPCRERWHTIRELGWFPMNPFSSPDGIPVVANAEPALFVGSVAWIVTSNGIPQPVQCPWSIGRAPSNAMALADRQLSRQHATISRHGERDFWLCDHDSRNGTFLNGHRLQQPERLFDGDRGIVNIPIHQYLSFCKNSAPRR